MSIFQMGLGFPKQTNLRNFHWLLFFFFFPRSVCILSLFSSLFYCFLTFNSQFFFYFSFISLLVKFLSFSFLTLYLSLLTLSDIFFDKTCHLPIFISLFPKNVYCIYNSPIHLESNKTGWLLGRKLNGTTAWFGLVLSLFITM